MTRAIVWKEWREQAAVLFALVGLGGGLLAATAILNATTATAAGISFRSVDAVGPILLLMLTLTAGVVCGGSLFAGEREQGTFDYLDHLPGSRWRVWWRKALAGGLMAGVAGVLLWGTAAVAGQLGGSAPHVLVGWLVAVLVLVFAGFGWGAVGSVRASNSLAACGLGLLWAVTTAGLALLGMAVFMATVGTWLINELDWQRPGDPSVLIGLLTVWTVLAVPLPLSAWAYTRPDRSRRLAEQDIRPVLDGGERWRPRLPRLGGFARGRRMLWLHWRQHRATLAVQGFIALLLGVALVPWTENWQSSLMWPGMGLLLGLLVGVASVGDEHRGGAVRFWAERRLPIGRLWRDKVLAGGFMTLVLMVLALLPSVIAAATRQRHQRVLVGDTPLSAMFESGLFGPGFPHLTYLFLGPVYGFAFGHLAGMLFPKGVVAGAVGLMVGGTLAAGWGPSLLGGGIHGCMVFVPPLIALLTARWLCWPWATDRLGRRGPLLRLAGGVLAATLALGGGLLFRAFDSYEVADPGEHLRFRDALPTFDETQAGRDLRRALSKWQELPAGRPQLPFWGWDGQATMSSRHPDRRYVDQAAAVLRTGWSARDRDLDRWLDEVAASDWDAAVFEAAAKPAGVLEDPGEMTGLFTPLRYINPFQEVTPVFLARGLQQQARGDLAAFVRRLDAWLAACRTAKRHTLPHVVLAAEGCERQVYMALTRWLERLPGHPELVQKALDVVRRHDTLDAPGPNDEVLAEQVVFQNAVDAPGQWLPRLLDGQTAPGRQPGARAEAEANLTAFAWAVPWERARMRQAVALGNQTATRPLRAELLRGAPGLGLYELFDRGNQRLGSAGVTITDRRAAITALALRLQRLQAGRYPETLNELVPGVLPAVPLDPYSGRPLSYRRLAAAETVTLPASHVAPQAVAEPPGLRLGFGQYQVAAALAGGLTGWPFEPGWFDPDVVEGEGPPGAAGMGGLPGGWDGLPLSAEWQERLSDTEPRFVEVRLAAGRAVVWGVGPDGRDDGGVRMLTPLGPGGDLVYPVPDPPAVSRPTPAPEH